MKNEMNNKNYIKNTKVDRHVTKLSRLGFGLQFQRLEVNILLKKLKIL